MKRANPTITPEQAKQLAQFVIDHEDTLCAILGVRLHDAPIALAGVKLNRADQQMITDVLAQSNPIRISGIHHRIGRRDDLYRECNPFDRRSFENPQDEEDFQKGIIPPDRGQNYEAFLYEIARSFGGKIIPCGSWHRYFDRGLTAEQAIEAHNTAFPVF